MRASETSITAAGWTRAVAWLRGDRPLLSPWLLAAVLVSVVIAAVVESPSKTLPLRTAWFEDASGSVDFETARHADFRDYRGTLARGFTASAHWLRIEFELPDDSGDWLLRVRPAFLDRVTLFLPDAEPARPWRQLSIGERDPREQRGLVSPTPNARLDLPAGRHTIYARISSNNSTLVLVDALSSKRFQIDESRQWLLLALYFGLMLAMLFWALGEIRSRRRDPLLHAYLRYQLLLMLFAPAVLGWLGLFMAPAASDTVGSLVILLATCAALLFHRAFLRECGCPDWLLRAAAGVALGWLPLLVLFVAGERQIAMAGNAALAVGVSLLMLAGAATMRRGIGVPLRLVRAIHVVQAVTLLGHLLPVFGGASLLKAWMLYGALAQGAVSAWLMFLLLHGRAGHARREHAAALDALARAEQRADLEHQQRQASDAFLGMLAHELRTAMSVISVALGSGGGIAALARQSMQDIDGLVGRCLQAARVDGGRMTVVPEPLDAGDLLQMTIDQSPAPARFRVDGRLPPLVSDRQLLQTVLRNLLDNALKYSPGDASVDLVAAPQQRDGRAGVQLSVSNPVGPVGLPDPQRVFAKYYRAPAAHHRTGAGLGLYLVQRLADALGGEIRYRPDADLVRFELWLPL